jgi:hypothetical protein
MERSEGFPDLQGLPLGNVKAIGDDTGVGTLHRVPLGLLHELANHQDLREGEGNTKRA